MLSRIVNSLIADGRHSSPLLIVLRITEVLGCQWRVKKEILKGGLKVFSFLEFLWFGDIWNYEYKRKLIPNYSI